GGDARLGQEAPLVLLLLASGGGGGHGDGLEGDGAAEVGVVGLVDHAHHAATELLADLVPADVGGMAAQRGGYVLTGCAPGPCPPYAPAAFSSTLYTAAMSSWPQPWARAAWKTSRRAARPGMGTCSPAA